MTEFEDIFSKRINELVDSWVCPGCGSTLKVAPTIELFILADKTLLECIICPCGHDDHNAEMRMFIKFGGDDDK